LRKVKLETGEVVQNIALPQQYFGEGVTDWGHDLIEIDLTWQTGVGFVYDQFSFRKLRDFQ
jgi:glutamine cyclotransferase